jgi:NitT/TauT family transport system permease protein
VIAAMTIAILILRSAAVSPSGDVGGQVPLRADGRAGWLVREAGEWIGDAIGRVLLAPLAFPARTRPARMLGSRELGLAWFDLAWHGLVVLGIAAAGWLLFQYARSELTWSDLSDVVANGLLTLERVAVLICLATLVWVPIGAAVGLRPRLVEMVQPLAQFLAAFPANLLLPFAVYLIVRFDLTPKLGLSLLMILGTQWYILFNVIAGASAFPGDFREAAASFRISGWRWWRDVMLPGIFRYYVTGAITASGGAWNASIVSEAVSRGSTGLDGSGLGAYVARMTEAGDYPRIALGIAVMSVLVVAMNRLLWRPLYVVAERRSRLD